MVNNTININKTNNNFSPQIIEQTKKDHGNGVGNPAKQI